MVLTDAGNGRNDLSIPADTPDQKARVEKFRQMIGQSRNPLPVGPFPGRLRVGYCLRCNLAPPRFQRFPSRVLCCPYFAKQNIDCL